MIKSCHLFSNANPIFKVRIIFPWFLPETKKKIKSYHLAEIVNPVFNGVAVKNLYFFRDLFEFSFKI